MLAFNRFLAVNAKNGSYSVVNSLAFFAWVWFPIFLNHVYNIAELGLAVKSFFMFLLAVKRFVSHFHRARLGEQNGFSYLNFHNTLSYTMASPLSSLFIVSQVSAHQQVMLAAPASASP